MKDAKEAEGFFGPLGAWLKRFLKTYAAVSRAMAGKQPRPMPALAMSFWQFKIFSSACLVITAAIWIAGVMGLNIFSLSDLVNMTNPENLIGMVGEGAGQVTSGLARGKLNIHLALMAGAIASWGLLSTAVIALAVYVRCRGKRFAAFFKSNMYWAAAFDLECAAALIIFAFVFWLAGFFGFSISGLFLGSRIEGGIFAAVSFVIVLGALFRNRGWKPFDSTPMVLRFEWGMVLLAPSSALFLAMPVSQHFPAKLTLSIPGPHAKGFAYVRLENYAKIFLDGTLYIPVTYRQAADGFGTVGRTAQLQLLLADASSGGPVVVEPEVEQIVKIKQASLFCSDLPESLRDASTNAAGYTMAYVPDHGRRSNSAMIGVESPSALLLFFQGQVKEEKCPGRGDDRRPAG